MTDLTANPSYRIQILQGKTYEELGPLSLEELMLLVHKDMLQPNSLYFDEKENTWKAISQHSELSHKLFPSANEQEEIYEVLFAKEDKPVLKEPKALKQEELKAFYAQGVITPNSIVFDKEQKTWVPLRSYKKLFHKLNPELEHAKPTISLPAASKTLAGRFALPSEALGASPSDATIGQGLGVSKDNLPTTHLHAKNVLPRIHERSAQRGFLDEGKVSEVDAETPSAPSTPKIEAVHTTASSENLYTTLGQTLTGLSSRKVQGSILQQVLSFIEPYSKWLMGLSGMCLFTLIYQYHQEDCKHFLELIHKESAMQYLVQQPAIPVLAIYFLLSLQILAPLQGLSRLFRLSIGVVGGACLGYYASYLREASIFLQGALSLGGALLGMLGMALPTSFSFGMVRVLSLILGGYLGFIYKTLGHTSLFLGLSLGVISLYLGCYPYPLCTGRFKHLVFLIFSTFILVQLCIFQFIF